MQLLRGFNVLSSDFFSANFLSLIELTYLVSHINQYLQPFFLFMRLIQQLLTECQLWARHCNGAMDIAMNKTDEIPALMELVLLDGTDKKKHKEMGGDKCYEECQAG